MSVLTCRGSLIQSVAMKRILLAHTLLSALLVFSGSCALFEPAVAEVWTNVPEIAAYAEIYNAVYDRPRINVVFRHEPYRMMGTYRHTPDIIIERNLNSSQTIRSFFALDSLFRKEQIDQSAFYPELLALGIHESEQLLLPLSFSLQGIMHRRDDLEIDSSILSLDELKEFSGRHNRKDTSGNFQQMGFSPSWSSAAAMQIAGLHGSIFKENYRGQVSWDPENLESAIEYMRNWITELNEGTIADQDFQQKYLYDPGFRLLNTSPARIRFYPVSLHSFTLLPARYREPLQISWLHNEQKIPVSSNIVFAGIHLSSRQARKTAEEFLIWLFSKEAQQQILETIRFKRIRSFGIANGLSGLVAVNEQILPVYYPFLTGRIPPPHYLDFPQALPPEFEELSHTIIQPWLLESLLTEEIQTEKLDEEVFKWYLQQPRY